MRWLAFLFSFRGRCTRLPFWIVTLILVGWGSSFSLLMGPWGPENPMTLGPVLVTIINIVIVLWIGLAVEIKRWHDRNKSWRWALLNLIPIVGKIWIFIECGILLGTEGDNDFGRKPSSFFSSESV
ncbi:DUF805 domain-containing protein [Candidatus Haliotispira prima]|uniref:DUF805 domain-containing protein n=1 Tax=Candidatus Haliotispira prima TaxID=3034016 RepID=A0ABY8MIG6_9SPIO|nr:DUF805 domain-containing protein [Candidatus Haliotispira prima]